MRLEVKNLNMNYGEEVILKNLNLEIEGASTIGIIGESGCGKSTFLRILSGIEDADSGEIEIDGLSPARDKCEFQEKIGVVFQKHNLFPHLTIKKNITLILHEIKKMDKHHASQKADELLEQLYITNEANKLPHEVSGGQAQRGSIARALATDPQLIFLDEPTAALDPLLTEEVLKAVKGLKKDGRDFIFVTHEIGFLKEFADYVIFLKDGEVWECGEKECLESPKTLELATFLKI